MTAHADISFYQYDAQYHSLRKPFTLALSLHAALLAGYVLYRWTGVPVDPFGDKNAGGNAVSITVTNTIPLPRTEGQLNPVANDTKSLAPQEPAKQERVKEEPKDAIPIKGKVPKKTPSEVASERQLFRPFEANPNQLTSKSAPAMVSPMFSQNGAGQLGITNSTLGDRFADYARQIRLLVSQKWHPDAADKNKAASVVVATFEIHRDGSIGGVTIKQASGIYTLDNSVRRAISEAAPFPALPAAYDKSSAGVEFSFEMNQ